MKRLNKEIPEFSLRYLNTTSFVGIIIFSLTSVAYYFGITSITRSSFIVFDHDLQYTKGKVVSISETSFSKSGEAAHYPIFEIIFSYDVRNVTHVNLGYTTSKTISLGDELNIAYKETNPKVSRASTLEGSPFGLSILLGIVLPLAGLMLFFKGVRWGNRFILLVKNGVVVYGQLLTVTGSGEFFKYYYVYEDGNGNKRRVTLENSDKKANEKEEILYDERDPAKAVVVNWDNLPILFKRNMIIQILKSR